MFRRRRGEIQILIDILTLCRKSMKLTSIMYRANLSYATVRKYLSIALRQGLIEKVCDDRSVVYCITEKGKLVLKKLREVEDFLQL